MNIEKINIPTAEKDHIDISIECTERADQFPLPEFKNFITIKLYIMNSSSSPIEFAPINLVAPEQNEKYLQKTTFKISNILVNKQKRPEETFICQHIIPKVY